MHIHHYLAIIINIAGGLTAIILCLFCYFRGTTICSSLHDVIYIETIQSVVTNNGKLKKREISIFWHHLKYFWKKFGTVFRRFLFVYSAVPIVVYNVIGTCLTSYCHTKFTVLATNALSIIYILLYTLSSFMNPGFILGFLAWKFA